MKKFSVNKRIFVLEDPPYSPDFDSKNKSALKRIHYQSVQEIKAKTTQLFKRVTSGELQHFYGQSKTHMQLCIETSGKYVEGNESSL